MSTTENPFAVHRSKLIGSDYSSALSLQSFVLSLYNGSTWQFRGDSLSNFDDEHLLAFLQMARWYHRYTESCPVFMSTCRDMIQERRQWAARNLRELEALRKMKIADYDGEPSDYYREIEDREKQYEWHKAHYLVDRDD
jgi:hypothetical protein